ncbi:MAG: hypothetical protein IKH92_01715 [Clostridiales bacterium]|nr:hypothetical protein [Clostridiales bacterium]
MTTKFDVGDVLFVAVKVTAITIEEEGVFYDTELKCENGEYSPTFKEKQLHKAIEA